MESTPLVPAPPSNEKAEPIRTIDEAVADAVLKYFNGPDYATKLQNTVCEEVQKQSKCASVASLDDIQIPCSPQPNKITSYTVCCNHCDATIHGTHYHCGSCENGDYDLCQPCVDKGIHCNEHHWLVKRQLEKGRFVSSTTETGYKKPVLSDFSPVFLTRTCNCCVASKLFTT